MSDYSQEKIYNIYSLFCYFLFVSYPSGHTDFSFILNVSIRDFQTMYFYVLELDHFADQAAKNIDQAFAEQCFCWWWGWRYDDRESSP